MSVAPPSMSSIAEVQVVLMARRLAVASLWAMVVEGWLARAAAARPQREAVETPTGDWVFAGLHAAARPTAPLSGRDCSSREAPGRPLRAHDGEDRRGRGRAAGALARSRCGRR